MWHMRVPEKQICPAHHSEGRTENESLGRSDVCWVAGGRSGAWAAGSGEKSGGSSNEGKFHEVNELVFD